MKIFEKIIIFIFLLGFSMKIGEYVGGSILTVFFGSILSLLYLFFGAFLLNDITLKEAFKNEKKTISTNNWVIAVASGF